MIRSGFFLAYCLLFASSTAVGQQDVATSARRDHQAEARPLVVGVAASRSQSGNPASHALDNDTGTKWAALGRGEWIEFVLNRPATLREIQIGFGHGERQYRFQLKVQSNDGWRTLKPFTSSGQGDGIEEFRFEPATTQRLRVVCQGSDASAWNNIHTLRIPEVGVRLSEASRDTASETSPQGAPGKRSAVSLEFTRWSGDLNIPDPVAISFANDGRAYVTQTLRRKSQDLDIRQYRQWIPDDVGFESVDDKRRFYHEMLAPANGKEPRSKIRFRDENGDGSLDYRDLTVISEKLHTVEDVDGDGTADRVRLFAEGFQSEVTGIAAGVLAHDDSVYATIAPDVWRLRDTNGDGVADQREVMATGFGLHIAYAGHDMHGLTIGPDGKIYWSIGDKGISATSKEGRRFHFPNQGGVMRCNPDGSDFEVFAHGLRNVQELAFDQFGNLFGVDNDADQPGERERVVYIARGMDAGWRCNYQYRGAGYNPWTAEKLWTTWFEGQAAYITPPLKHSLNGPAGFAFNPGTALSPEYKDYFFLTGAPGGEQVAFQMKASGATFQVVNEHAIGRGIPLVGINFGPDGGLYGVDWGGGYPLNQKGAIWKLDAPDAAAAPARRNTASLLKRGFTEAPTRDLAVLLGHDDQRVRLGSQFQLVKRGEIETLSAISLDAEQSQLARVHAVWGLGQLTRQENNNAPETLLKLSADQDPELRTQALRVIADIDRFQHGDALAARLNDQNPRVQFQAAIAVGEHGVRAAVAPLIRLASKLKPNDSYWRHALVMGLSGAAASEELAALHAHDSAMVRLVAVVALRRQYMLGTAKSQRPLLSRFVQDQDADVAAEAARAIYEGLAFRSRLVDDYRAEAESLAAALDASPHQDEAYLRRAIGAAFLIGDQHQALRVAGFSARGSVPLTLRLDALAALGEWAQPPQLDRVDGRRRDYPSGDRRQATEVLGPALVELFGDRDASIRAAAVQTIRRLGIRFGAKELRDLAELAGADDTPSDLRVESINALHAQGYPNLQPLLVGVRKSKDPASRMRALELIADPSRVLHEVSAVLGGSAETAERQHAMRRLGRLGTPASDKQLQVEFKAYIAGGHSGLGLELLEAARQRSAHNTAVRSLLGEYEEERARRAETDPLIQWQECLDGGDAEAGRKLFMTHITAACARCHRVGATGSTVGPNLQSIARQRNRRHLLRAIVNPSADIEPRYRTQTLALESGKVVQGVLVRRDKKHTVLADEKGKEIKVLNSDVEEAVERKTSIMPDMTKTLKRREIRDLVAFLVTLQTPDPHAAPTRSTAHPLIFEDDFEKGRGRWEVTDEKSWRLRKVDGDNTVFGIKRRESDYKPKVRSPRHIALIKDVKVADFELTFRVRGPNNTGGHRDCCVFFNHQDPAHFYYVHLGAKPDPASGQIMIVNGQPRTPITDNKRLTPWTDGWHQVKVVRESARGTIEIYFDDMSKPHMTAVDKTFGRGRIGLGSFDDINDFDDVRLYGR